MFYLDSRYRGAATEEKRFHLIQGLHRVVHPTQRVVPVSRLDCKETRTEAAILLNVCFSVYTLAVLMDHGRFSQGYLGRWRTLLDRACM